MVPPDPTRRALLAAGVGAAFALPAAREAAAGRSPGPPPSGGMKFALKVGMIGAGANLAEKLALAKRVGYDGVELDSPCEHPLDEVLAAKASAGIEIPGVVDSAHWRDTLGDPDAAVRARGVAALETALRDARAWGATSVLLVPGVVNERMAYDDVMRRSRAEVARCLPLAEELGVDILFENVWNGFLLTPVEAARYVDEFESPRVGWHFDVGNVVNFGWPEQWIRILGARIKKLDVKEFSREKRDREGLWKGFAVEIGEGDCGWERVREALRDVGYSGWAAAEVGGGDEARLADVLRRMRAVLTP